MIVIGGVAKCPLLGNFSVFHQAYAVRCLETRGGCYWGAVNTILILDLQVAHRQLSGIRHTSIIGTV